MCAMGSDMRSPGRVSQVFFCAALLASSVVLAQENAALNSVMPVAATSPLLELQVLSTFVVVREAPDSAALVLAQVQRGNLLSVGEQRGEWFKVALSSNTSGWILREPGEYGEMTVGLFPAKGLTGIAGENNFGKIENPIDAVSVTA